MKTAHIMSRFIVFFWIIFISSNNIEGRVPYRLKESILKSSHYYTPDNPNIISNIKADSLFCIASANNNDTICIMVQAKYDMSKQYMGYTCHVVKFLNENSTKMTIGWIFYSNKNYKNIVKNENETLLYPIYKQQKKYIESWITPINETRYFKRERFTYWPDHQQYTLDFIYILVPEIHTNH